jgi:hypothetical protein
MENFWEHVWIAIQIFGGIFLAFFAGIAAICIVWNVGAVIFMLIGGIFKGIFFLIKEMFIWACGLTER